MPRCAPFLIPTGSTETYVRGNCGDCAHCPLFDQAEIGPICRKCGCPPCQHTLHIVAGASSALPPSDAEDTVNASTDEDEEAASPTRRKRTKSGTSKLVVPGSLRTRRHRTRRLSAAGKTRNNQPGYKGRIIYNTRYQENSASSSGGADNEAPSASSSNNLPRVRSSAGDRGSSSSSLRRSSRSSATSRSAGAAAASEPAAASSSSSTSAYYTSSRRSGNSTRSSTAEQALSTRHRSHRSSSKATSTKSNSSARGAPYSTASEYSSGSRSSRRRREQASGSTSSRSAAMGGMPSKNGGFRYRERSSNGRGGHGGDSSNRNGTNADQVTANEAPMPTRLEMLMDMPSVSRDIQTKHAWNEEDRSYNIFVKEEDKLTFHRHPVAQSTDCIRARVGYERGLHLFEITWSTRQRGTHAVVGVSTADAPVHSVGYQSLVGNNEHSWGWDLGRNKVYHDSKNSPGRPYPANLKNDETFVVPDKFMAVLDMDEGTLGYVVDGRYLGPAFRGLRGKKLYLMVSAVWGHCEITMKYIGGMDPEPLPLMDLCRRVIRVNINKERIEKGKISELNLPKTIQDYLEYKERRLSNAAATTTSPSSSSTTEAASTAGAAAAATAAAPTSPNNTAIVASS